MILFHYRQAMVGTVGLIVLAISGCGIEPETISRIEQMSRQHSTAFSSIETPPELNITRVSSEGFTVPFPDRRDPFQVTDKGKKPQNKAITASNVSVMGFAKLGEQQAILKVGGETRFVVVGDRVGDVEVMAINPPRVRLKNGNLVWDASMFQSH